MDIVHRLATGETSITATMRRRDRNPRVAFDRRPTTRNVMGRFPAGLRCESRIAVAAGRCLAAHAPRCAPESPERDALMPTAALARLFRVESAKFDQRLLSMLIKLLGVYPPGTIVRLSDESHGLVVAPGKESLRPTILIYNPEFEKQDAPTVNLAEVPELRVEAALPPASVPADILHWLKPRERLSYFFSSDTN